MPITFSKPDFWVVGPFRTGTTWLYSQLHEVQGIRLPPYKEISFFSDADKERFIIARQKSMAEGTWDYNMPSMHVERDTILGNWTANGFSEKKIPELLSLTGKPFWVWYYARVPRKINWISTFLYTKLFAQRTSVTSGDISPAYFLMSAEAVRRISVFFPKLKIVIILRDPVEREWSDIRVNYFNRPGKDSFSPETYFKQSHPLYYSDYKRALTLWERYFSHERILYLFYDDLKNDPQKFMRSFLQFVRPEASNFKLLTQPVGQGPDMELPAAVKAQLLERNMAQYDFLAGKFGRGSHPEKWKEKALAGLSMIN